MRHLARTLIAIAVAVTALPALAQKPIAVETVEKPEIQFLRQDLAETVLNGMARTAGKELDAEWRGRVKAKLLELSLEELQASAEAGRPPRLLVETVLGSSTNDMVYTPLTPCRILDTRSGPSHRGPITGPLTPGTTYSFDVATFCGVPFPKAKAVVLNFVAMNPSGPGNLQAWPWDASSPAAPLSSVINYGSSAGINIANGIVLPICNTATSTEGSCADDLFVKANVSPVNLILDVLGYLSPPETTAVQCEQGVREISVETANTGFNVYTLCPAGYLATGGGFRITSWAGSPPPIMTTSRPFGSNFWECGGMTSASGMTGECYVVCCQVPGAEPPPL